MEVPNNGASPAVVLVPYGKTSKSRDDSVFGINFSPPKARLNVTLGFQAKLRVKVMESSSPLISNPQNSMQTEQKALEKQDIMTNGWKDFLPMDAWKVLMASTLC